MSTRSTSSNLYSLLRDPESLIRRRNLGEASSLFDFKKVMSIPHNNMGPPPTGPPPPNNNGPPLVVRHNEPAPRSMEELCQPSINGRGGPIAPIPIQAMDFGLRHHMIQQELIENVTAHHNHWDTSATRDETSRNISSTTTTESPEVVRQLEMMNKNFLDMMRQIQSVKSVSPKCETCDGPHSFTEFLAVDGYTQEAAYATTGSFAHVQPPVVQDQIPEPEVASKPKPKPLIPYPSRLNDQNLREKDNNQMLKFLQIFQRLHFDISFADALLHMPKFASTFKSLLSNKEKLFELVNTLLNENCSAVLLKKLPQKLGDPGKFLISCDFSELDECLALVDLGVSINLIPISVWKKLSLPELTSTCMTLEIANQSAAHPKGVAEDIFVKVGKFYFPADFIVVVYDVDPRVPLITGRPFLRTARALIDVYGEELTLRVDDEAIMFKVGHTSRYSHNCKTVNQVNVIDIACEEYAQEVLGFLDSSTSGNPTLLDPIIASSSPLFTPFEGGDSILEEIETFLYPSLTIPLMENDKLKQVDVTMTKPSIEEPPELKLKDLPSHLEYVFLEGTDKLPVIISKELKDEEKAALLKVLKSHKRAIAWKIFDIKGINPSFCTHKILMEDDFKPAVQHQRRVNLKIHEVIKKVVIKLLDAGLIYPISDSLWVSPTHCVPKKGGMTVVENEDNELIPTRLVTGWRVCIDYRKPNDATRKDHFPLHGTNARTCMMAIFLDMIEETMEVFLDDFLVFGDYFSSCLSHLDKMLKRCEETNLVLNWEKCHFMVKEGIVLGHKISKSRIEVDRAKVDVIAKLPHPTSVKGAVLGQRKTKHFQPIHYASKTMTDAQAHYTTTEKELLAVVYAFEKFQPYLVLSKTIVYTDHSALKYLLAKQDAKPRLLRWILLLQEFDVIIRDKKGAENLAADHLSRLENPYQGDLEKKKINETFPLETLGMITFHGPFPSSLGNKYILVAVDYLSKWVEVKVLPTNDARVIVKFLKSLFSRFGTPRAIISDRGTYFCNDQFAKVMLKYGVTRRLSTAYHLQTSGQVEVSNHGLKRILERTIGENRASWSDKLDDALWAFRTAFKTPIGCTPYKLVYGKACHLPIELEREAY
ncbi:reverse transcriptase domain-containing protein [Tanacetum coccineum]